MKTEAVTKWTVTLPSGAVNSYWRDGNKAQINCAQGSYPEAAFFGALDKMRAAGAKIVEEA